MAAPHAEGNRHQVLAHRRLAEMIDPERSVDERGRKDIFGAEARIDPVDRVRHHQRGIAARRKVMVTDSIVSARKPS